MAQKVLLVACLLVACSGLVASYPIHASCKITWNFNTTCAFVYNAITKQMDTWKGTDCGSGEKCRYAITKSESPSIIEGTHMTPVKHYVDDLKFALSGTSCTVDAQSSSETWYAVLDYGTNYCNLHNLVVGAQINVPQYGFKETTSNSVCTQYTSANCDKY